MTLPGSKSIKNRSLQEEKLLWKKKFRLREKDNQAFVSRIDSKFSAAEIPETHPSSKKKEEPLDKSGTRKGYPMKQFILRETYNFMKPEEYD